MRWLRTSFGVVWVGLLLLAAGRVGWAEEAWTEVRSPNFRVVTNGSAEDGRRVAAEFEQMRYVIHYRIPSFRVDSGSPLLVMAVRDEATARSLEPALWRTPGPKPAGVFHPGWERNYAMVRLDQWKAGARSVVYHEYTHSVLHLNAHWLPRWLDEGLAEFFGYTQFEDKRILMGVVTDRWRTLGDQRLLPVETVLGMQPADYMGDERKVQLFYAESWALVHYMTFGPGMDSGRKLFAFYDKLQAGEEQRVAFAGVFGDGKEFDKQFQRYLHSGSLKAGIVPSAPAMHAEGFPARQLTAAQAANEQGAYLIGTKDMLDGKARIEDALRLDPGLGAAHEEMGYLQYEMGNREVARREWGEAVRLDGGLYRARFALGMTGIPVWEQTGTERETTAGVLQGVVQSHPQFAPAYVELAILLWREGELAQALLAAREAERLEPWRAGYHLLTGRILLAQGEGARAAGIARYVAGLWTGTDRNEAVELWQAVPGPARGVGPSLGWDLPLGVKVIRGVLTGVACPIPGSGQRLAVEVRPEEGTSSLTLLASGDQMTMGFSDTLWFGEDHLAFCKDSVGMPTTVTYRPEGTGEGQLLWLDLRDSLPEEGAGSVAKNGGG